MYIHIYIYIYIYIQLCKSGTHLKRFNQGQMCTPLKNAGISTRGLPKTRDLLFVIDLEFPVDCIPLKNAEIALLFEESGPMWE